MKRAFSLVELMIVIAMLGILAAIVVPQFQSHTTEAKEAAAKNNLHILRAAIELYAARHNDVPPGYYNDDPSEPVMGVYFYRQMVLEGHYMSKLPENPFNENNTIMMIGNDQDFPETASGSYGWVYQPATKLMKLDWPGTDSTGVAYFDY